MSAEPLRSHPDLPPIGGSIGSELDDFRVEELPAYEPSGEGEHRYVRVEKRGLAAGDLIAWVARAAGIAERDVGAAGMKDKQGVTVQWLSLPWRSRAPTDWEPHDKVRVLAESRHGNKLRTGHLRGNAFRIRLVELADGAFDRVEALVARIAAAGVLNRFGSQRFGRDGDNFARAIEWFEAGMPSLGGRTRFYKKLYPSVVQSELFNRYAVARRERGLDALLDGEVVRLAGTGSSFVVEELERERARYATGDLVLTGPMPGPKMKRAARAAAELEATVSAELGLSERALAALGELVDGTRRDVVVVPGDLRWERADGGLWLSFSLPAGSYATVVVEELTGSPARGATPRS